MSTQLLALVGREGQAPPATPNAAAQLIGATLRHLRKKKGLTLEQVAARKDPEIGSLATVQRCEKSTAKTLKEERVRALLRVYKASGEIREEVETLLKQSRGEQWWTHFSDITGEIMLSLLALEAESKVIKTCHHLLIPGLLQTAGYARAVMEDFYNAYPDPKTREKNRAIMERRLELRLRRQHLLDQQDGPELTAVIHEVAVRQMRGGRNVMREQLRQLHSFGENKPNLHVRVLPASATRSKLPVHPAMTLFKPHDSATGRTIYLEDMNRGGTFYSEPGDVEVYQASIDDCWDMTLSKQQTLDFFLECIADLSTTPAE
ncbi:helix-turn-helix domain-containing protein [Streptomyces angustmyceticus]|uniref:helix-turn-helix domain-containing protein n=1 Tax=Streptomyces angustmyceticus TaxID=285578 RepID=UPI003D905977